MIVVIDYNMGNLGSILNMLKKVGAQAIASSNFEDIEKADKLILPGVGSFDNAIRNMKNSGLLPILNNKVIKDKTPILGICLGMQLFTLKSEEGIFPGLGWINGETVRFRFDNGLAAKRLKIPHMGWNSVVIKKGNTLFDKLDDDARFYFVHSYHVVCDSDEVLSETNYGYDFVSSVRKDNIFGVQFHPEKSHKYGMQVMKNFTEIK